MQNFIQNIKRARIFILFVTFWILIIIGVVKIMNSNLETSTRNTDLINRNFEELMKKDSAHKELLKNDSIILQKLEELLEENISK